MKMRKNSKEIALSAVACALGTLGLTVGTLYSPMLFTGYLFACLCMMLPLSRGYFKGAALCYAAMNVLTLLFNGFNFFDTLPFTMFFGLHPLVNEWQARLHEARQKRKPREKRLAEAGKREKKAKKTARRTENTRRGVKKRRTTERRKNDKTADRSALRAAKRKNSFSIFLSR